MHSINVLFVNPFVFKKGQMSEEILIGPLYIENFLNSRIKTIKSDLLDFTCEEKLNNFNPYQIQSEDKFFDQMDQLLSSIDFELNNNSIIGLSCPTSKHYIPSILTAKYFHINYPQTPIIVGGAHVSSQPNDFVFSESLIDYIIIGEGEISFLEILKNGALKRLTPVIYPNNPIEQLGYLPIINFDMFKKYNKLYKTISISLSRGCPFNCSFCMEKNLIEAGKIHKTWRSYKPSRAIAEFKAMLEFGAYNNVKSYGLYDPLFGFRRKWLLKFLEMYPKNPDYHVWTECRLDILNKEVLSLLNERNFSLMYGLETYSKEMLLIMNKTKNPAQYLKKFNEVIETSEKLEMFCVLNLIINHPGETKKTFSETLKFIRLMSEKINFVNLNYNLYRNFPGTPIYSNLDFYREQYGSEFYILEWWKNKEYLEFGPYAIRPSKDLSFRVLLDLYFPAYIEFQERIIENMKLYKKQIGDYFNKTLFEKLRLKSLNTQYNEIIKFLDDNNIEVDV